MMIKIRRRKKKIILIRDFLSVLLVRCLFVEGEGEGRTMELCLWKLKGEKGEELCIFVEGERESTEYGWKKGSGWWGFIIRTTWIFF